MICYKQLPVHLVPFPRNLSLHLQLYDPRVLLHSAFTSQLCVPSAHSSKSRELKKKHLLYGTCFYVFMSCFVVLLFSRLFALVGFWDVIVSYFNLIFSLPCSRQYRNSIFRI